MANLTSTLTVRLRDAVTGPARAVANSIRGIGNAVAGANRSGRVANGFLAASAAHAQATGAAVGAATRRIVALGAGYIGVTSGIRGTIGAAAAFQEQLTGIQKKAGATTEQMAGLRKEILALATGGQVAASIDEIASAFERGAAAGIPLDELREFARLTTMAADAFEMTAEDVANAAAGFEKGLGVARADMERLFDLINSLADAGIADERDIVDFLDRVGASLKNFGLAKEEAAALGATLINLKMPAEVAARAMDTLTGKLLAPSNLSKKAHSAFAEIVGDAEKFAEIMRSNPQQGLLHFLERLEQFSAEDRSRLLGGVLGEGFDDEVLRLVAGLEEYRRNLRLAADEEKWLGSLGKSYGLKLNDLNSQLEILGNNIRKIGIDLGTSTVGPLTEGARQLSFVLSTLDDRVSVFDRLAKAVSGFMAGLGFDGSFAEGLSSFLDTIFGSLKTFEEDTDALARIHEVFRGIGSALRELGLALRAIIEPLIEFLGIDWSTFASYAITFGIAAAGLGLLAKSIMGLGRALLFLTGAKVGFALLKSIAKWGTKAGMLSAAAMAGSSLLGGSTAAPKAGAMAVETAASTATASKGGGLFSKLLRGGGILGGALLVKDALDLADPEGNLWGLTSELDAWVERNLGINPSKVNFGEEGETMRQTQAAAADAALSAWRDQFAAMDAPAPAPAPLPIDPRLDIAPRPLPAAPTLPAAAPAPSRSPSARAVPDAVPAVPTATVAVVAPAAPPSAAPAAHTLPAAAPAPSPAPSAEPGPDAVPAVPTATVAPVAAPAAPDLVPAAMAAWQAQIGVIDMRLAQIADNIAAMPDMADALGAERMRLEADRAMLQQQVTDFGGAAPAPTGVTVPPPETDPAAASAAAREMMAGFKAGLEAEGEQVVQTAQRIAARVSSILGAISPPAIRLRVDDSALRGVHADTGVE